MARIERRPAAERDAVRIWRYIARDNAAAADAQIFRFEEKLARLAEHPEMGQERPEIRPGLRSFTVGSYLLLYRPLSDGVILIRIMHGARDATKVFPPR